MSDEEYEENVMRDLCAVSQFGDLEAIMQEFRDRKRRMQNVQVQQPEPRRAIPRRSRWRSKGKFTIRGDDDDGLAARPSYSRGRGTPLPSMSAATDGYEMSGELRRDLDQIGAGNFRNETIEEYYREAHRRNQFKDDSDEDQCAANVMEVPASTLVPTPASDPAPAPASAPVSASAFTSLPVGESTPAATKAKKKKPKKKRNVVLETFLAKKTDTESHDGSAQLDGDTRTSKVIELATDEDADTCTLGQNILLMSIGDSYTSSELEVVSQETYLREDGQDSLVDGVSTSSVASSVSKGSSKSWKTAGSSSTKSSSSYHRNSRRKKMLPMSPTTQNPILGRRSPQPDVYVPHIVETSYTYKKYDFPPL